MNASIRPARVEDAGSIARVQVASWRSTYAGIIPDTVLDGLSVETQTAMWQAQFVESGLLIFVAEEESGVFGFVSGGALREPVKHYDGELYAIYLLRSRQGRGVGRALCRILAESIAARGFTAMLVWVLEANPAASFYRSLGGVEEARRLIMLGDVELPELAFGWPRLALLL